MPPKQKAQQNSNDATTNSRDKNDTEENEDKPRLPVDLAGKLLKNFMEDEGTRVSGAATKTVEEYMQLFISEAIFRAVGARRDGDPWAKDQGAGLMLEVEDLEKVAPQLLLDF